MLVQFESLALQAGQRKQQAEQASAPLVDRPQDSDVPWNWQSELAQVPPIFCWRCVRIVVRLLRWQGADTKGAPCMASAFCSMPPC